MKRLKKRLAYPQQLPWAQMINVVRAGDVVNIEETNYIIKQKLVSSIPGSIPKLYLESTL